MNDKFDLLMAFPRYRRLVNRLKVTNRDNRNLRRNWEEQIVINENLKYKLKQREKTINLLRKELKELKGYENKGGYRSKINDRAKKVQKTM